MVRVGHLRAPLTPDDWLVKIVYIDFAGREKRRTIGVHSTTHEEITEQQAIFRALNSLRKSTPTDFILPPEIKDVRARLRSEIGISKTIDKAAELAQRFARR